MKQYSWRWEDIDDESPADCVALVFTTNTEGDFQDEFIRLLMASPDEPKVQRLVNGLNAIELMSEELRLSKLQEGTPSSDLLDINDIVENISDALAEKEGEDVAEIHNRICDTQVKYLGDNLWQRE
jgi:hypothetical protein